MRTTIELDSETRDKLGKLKYELKIKSYEKLLNYLIKKEKEKNEADRR